MQGHVEPEFPYISDDATYSPESCVFGQLINMGSVLCKYSIIKKLGRPTSTEFTEKRRPSSFLCGNG